MAASARNFFNQFLFGRRIHQQTIQRMTIEIETKESKELKEVKVEPLPSSVSSLPLPLEPTQSSLSALSSKTSLAIRSPKQKEKKSSASHQVSPLPKPLMILILQYYYDEYYPLDSLHEDERARLHHKDSLLFLANLFNISLYDLSSDLSIENKQNHEIEQQWLKEWQSLFELESEVRQFLSTELQKIINNKWISREAEIILLCVILPTLTIFILLEGVQLYQEAHSKVSPAFDAYDASCKNKFDSTPSSHDPFIGYPDNCTFAAEVMKCSFSLCMTFLASLDSNQSNENLSEVLLIVGSTLGFFIMVIGLLICTTTRTNIRHLSQDEKPEERYIEHSRISNELKEKIKLHSSNHTLPQDTIKEQIRKWREKRVNLSYLFSKELRKYKIPETSSTVLLTLKDDKSPSPKKT